MTRYDATTRGAVTGALAGLFSSVILVVFSKTVWVAVFGFKSALFPYENPALFSMPLAFLCIWLFSITDKSAQATLDKEGYEAQRVRSETGIGAVGASGH